MTVLKEGRRITDRYKIGPKLGSGSFGSIYQGRNIATRELVAIKYENATGSASSSQLWNEHHMYRLLKGGLGMPEVKSCGTEGDKHVMVMELLGPSLEDLFKYCHRQFSLKTVCLLGEQMITRLEYIHSKDYIHRDVKPDNFVMGIGEKKHLVHAIDFGFAKRWRLKNRQHIPFRDRLSLVGTARYCSINAHKGVEQTRRDDLEALGHVLIYFMHGSKGLPWSGLAAATMKQKYEKIAEKKMSMPTTSLCRNCPPEFATFLEYSRKLGYEQAPDYNYLRTLMRKVLEQNNWVADNNYEWVALKHPFLRLEASQSKPREETRTHRESSRGEMTTSTSHRGGNTTTSSHRQGQSEKQRSSRERRPSQGEYPVNSYGATHEIDAAPNGENVAFIEARPGEKEKGSAAPQSSRRPREHRSSSRRVATERGERDPSHHRGDSRQTPSTFRRTGTGEYSTRGPTSSRGNVTSALSGVDSYRAQFLWGGSHSRQSSHRERSASDAMEGSGRRRPSSYVPSGPSYVPRDRHNPEMNPASNSGPSYSTAKNNGSEDVRRYGGSGAGGRLNPTQHRGRHVVLSQGVSLPKLVRQNT